MKGVLLYFLLAGMVLIHIPRTVLHECEHHSHSCDHEENQNEQNTDLSFHSDECDLCMYAFNALDTPGSELILPMYLFHVNHSSIHFLLHYHPRKIFC